MKRLSQEKTLQDLDGKIAKQAETRLNVTQEQDEKLAKAIRRSTETGNLVKLRRILKECGVAISKSKMESFRDYLIINRLDMKDLEPMARGRLREKSLSKDDASKMTKDYRDAICSGSVPNCRDCRWFVTGPVDENGKSEDPCVTMGTKGADDACFGFRLRPS